MNTRSRQIILNVVIRGYRQLLTAYPPSFSVRYRDEMVHAFEERCHELNREPTVFPLVFWWGVAVVDLAISVVLTHLDALKGGDNVMARILSMSVQAIFAVTGTSLFLYVVFKRPISFRDAGVLLCIAIACLSIALAWGWASTFRSRGVTNSRHVVQKTRTW